MCLTGVCDLPYLAGLEADWQPLAASCTFRSALASLTCLVRSKPVPTTSPHGGSSHNIYLTTANSSITLSNMAVHADAAEEPLMQREGDAEAHDDDEQEEHVSLMLEKNLRRPGRFVWLLTLTAGMTGLLFGCE